MTKSDPASIPMPIRTPRLLIRPREPGDAAAAVAAVHETWDELHRWMAWAEDPDRFTVAWQEARYRRAQGNSKQPGVQQPEIIELIGIELASELPVVWCGLHDIDWSRRQCDTGFWVRKSAHGCGFATEAANAMVRYAFGALGMQQVGLTHSRGNQPSRRIAEKLGFIHLGVQPAANPLPGGIMADRVCYARTGIAGLPSLEVSWPQPCSSL